MEEEVQKWVIIGGVLEGVYSFLAPIIAGLFALAHGESRSVIEILFLIIAAPALTYTFFHNWLDFEKAINPKTGLEVIRQTGNSGFAVNFFLWIFIGALVGYAYGKWKVHRRRKEK